MDRLRTGAFGLDKILHGGLPRGSVSIVVGPTGSGKSILGLQFLLEGVFYKKPAILVDTSDLVPALKQTVEEFGRDPAIIGMIEQLDCYSWKTGTRSPQRFSANPNNLPDLSIALSKTIDDLAITPASNCRLVFDSFSDVILHSPDYLKFLPTLRGKLSKAGITSMILLESGMHDEKTISTVEHESDGTISLKADESGRAMMVRRMMATPTELKWVPYKISRGMEVKAEAFFD